MAFSIAWILDKMGQKMYAWATTKSVMDFDRGGENGQTLQKTLNNLENNSISIYTHSKSGTTHALTGTGNNIKFVADAAYNEDDTITVNGTTVTAQTQDGATLSGGAWASGAVVACYLDGTTLNFKGGGGLSAADKANLTPENIRNGVTIAKVTGTLTWQDLLPKVVAAQDANTIDELLGGLTAGTSISLASGGVNAVLSSSEGGWRFNNPIDCSVFSAVRFHYNGTYRRNDGYTTFGIGSQDTSTSGFSVSKKITNYPGTGSVQIDLPESGSLFVRAYVFASNMLVTKTELIKRK